MKIYFDTGIWSQLARDRSGTDRLSALVRQRRHQVLLSATAWGEIHGIGEQDQRIYDTFTHALRALAWDRIPRDALELLALEFIRYSARILRGDYLRESGTLDASFFTEVRFSRTQDLTADAWLRQFLNETRSRNRQMAAAFRRPQLATGEFQSRVDLYRRTVTTPGAAKFLTRVEHLPADQRICPFIASFRDGWADVETQAKANDMLLLNRLVQDCADLPNIPEEPWLSLASRFLKRHAPRFDQAFWRQIESVDDVALLVRHRVQAFVLHYLLANGFAGEEGSFWFDLQHAVYAHDVRHFYTTDNRLARALQSEYLTSYFARRGGPASVIHVAPDQAAAGRVLAELSRV